MVTLNLGHAATCITLANNLANSGSQQLTVNSQKSKRHQRIVEFRFSCRIQMKVPTTITNLNNMCCFRSPEESVGVANISQSLSQSVKLCAKCVRHNKNYENDTLQRPSTKCKKLLNNFTNKCVYFPVPYSHLYLIYRY